MLSFRDIAALLLALTVLATLAGAARADPFAEALDRFTADSFNDTIEGVNALAASGHPRAAAVITALRDGRLLFSLSTGRVVIGDPTPIDAATGAVLSGDAPADLATVRLNNRVRRIIEAALGALTLMAPDAARRLEAAMKLRSRAIIASHQMTPRPGLVCPRRAWVFFPRGAAARDCRD